MGTWNFVTFPKHSLGILYQIFEFLLCAEASPGPLSRGHVLPSFCHFVLKILETVKIWLCVMDLFIEKLVLKFCGNRSRNNEVTTFLNIWWTNGDCLEFWTPEPRICGFLDFRKRVREIEWRFSSPWEKSNGVYPIEIGLTVLELSRGAESAPSPVNVSRKPTSNRVKLNAEKEVAKHKIETRKTGKPLGESHEPAVGLWKFKQRSRGIT